MRHSSSVTSVSWIPSDAIPGPMKIPFSLGIGHYHPPGVLEVLVDRGAVAEIGPVAVVGERPCSRTPHVHTACVTHGAGRGGDSDQVDTTALQELAEGHRRGEQAGP